MDNGGQFNVPSEDAVNEDPAEAIATANSLGLTDDVIKHSRGVVENISSRRKMSAFGNVCLISAIIACGLIIVVAICALIMFVIGVAVRGLHNDHDEALRVIAGLVASIVINAGLIVAFLRVLDLGAKPGDLIHGRRVP